MVFLHATEKISLLSHVWGRLINLMGHLNSSWDKNKHLLKVDECHLGQNENH